jgi:CRISPR-associated protein Cas2
VERRLFLVLYDISSPRRWRKVHALLQAAGARTQLSAFFCRLTEARMRGLEAELLAAMDPATDRLLIADLGEAERAGARLRLAGRGEGPPRPPPFLLF